LLGSFRIDIAETAAGYGIVMDRVYDELIAELRRVNEIIQAALAQ
jgi:hypothetical protein